ncbi:MAG: ABC transporter substrate-binding protein [SAR202 cluster bacterium]|nr:ABC transporter substrate-binding protein [SAR202 cluster bacterium]MDP6713185.1 ABC transporter substrate-binding protein [SAR202 cluster bacterium]
MSLNPEPIHPGPKETVCVAKAAFPKGSFYLTLAAVVLLVAACGDVTPTSTPTPTEGPEAAVTAPNESSQAAAIPEVSSKPAALAISNKTPLPSAAQSPVATNTSAPIATTAIPINEYVQRVGYQPEWGQPKAGGILRYGASHFLKNHDPNYGHSFEGPQFLPTYNSLLRFDPWLGLAGPIEGDLVETWSVSSDSLDVVFTLRKGVKFQDNPNLPAAIIAKVSGDEFTCEDAKASIEFAITPPVAFTQQGLFHTGPGAALGHLSATSCPDGALGYTFLVEFNQPLAKTITMFAGASGMPNNMDKDFLDWLLAECITCLHETTPQTYLYGTGTGAFEPAEFQPNVVTKMRRNPTYFREGLPFLDGMDQFMIPYRDNRFAALLTGNIDYYGEGSFSLTPGQVAQVQKSFGDKIHIQPILHSWSKGIQLNMNKPPLDNVQVRKALHLGIDRDAWMEFNLAGTQIAA